MRVAAYTDYPYHRLDGCVYGERAFVLFLGRIASSVDSLLLPGRLSPSHADSHYPLDESITFIPLPHYESLAKPLAAAWAMLRSLRQLWRVLAQVDVVWVLGPHALSIAFALLAALRRRPVVLGVRQDLPSYVRSRHPGRRLLHLAARLLEVCFRLLARVFPVVVVGPELARHYSAARSLLEVSVSLVPADSIVTVQEAESRSYEGELQVLSVGRLETEKNPLLLAEVLAELRGRDDRYKLVVCGEGPMASQLERRLDELGLGSYAEVKGYVPFDRGLAELYRQSHVFLHVSLTEGLPQVLYEAFAAGLPVVATAVGGVSGAVGEAALLVPPSDASTAASAIDRMAEDMALRRRCMAQGIALVSTHTAERESERIVQFLRRAIGAGRPQRLS